MIVSLLCVSKRRCHYRCRPVHSHRPHHVLDAITPQEASRMALVQEIPTHKQWTALRDKCGGKSNMVSSVNMGKLLDDYHSAGTGAKNTYAAMVAQVKYITPLSKG